MTLKLRDSDETLERAIDNLESISEHTKKLYNTKLRTLPAAVLQATDKETTILRCISRPIQTYAALSSYRIRKGGKMVPMKPHTVHVTLSVVISIFKHFPELAKIMPKNTRVMWLNTMEQTREAAIGKYDDLEPSQEQKDAYIPFERIIAKRDQLLKLKKPTPHQRTAALVLSLYSMFPPRRSQDWAVMSVLDKRKRADAALLRQPTIDKQFPNRIVIDRNGTDMTVVFNQYKTAKKYGRQEFPVPAQLAIVIRDSLEHAPRRYLFEHSKDAGTSLTPKRFSEVVNTVLKSQFADVKGSPTIAMLRHSYIVAANVGNLTPRVAMSLARQMGHSRMQQLTYAYIIDENEKDTDSGGVCQLTCKKS